MNLLEEVKIQQQICLIVCLIMDTESFNYANANDVMHKMLDIKPPQRYDTDLRRQISSGWKSPSKKNYDYGSDKGDTYSRSSS